MVTGELISLVSQIASASPDELDNFIEAFKSDDSEAVEEVVTALKAAANTADREQDWPQKARLATLALHLQDPELAIDMCLGGADPVQRAWFVEECSKWYGYDSTLVDCAKSNGDSRLRAGLMLAVGSIPTEKVTDTRRREWERSLLEWFETEPDKLTFFAHCSCQGNHSRAYRIWPFALRICDRVDHVSPPNSIAR